MGSSRNLARCYLLLEGRTDMPLNSLKEVLALEAFRHRQRTSFLQTKAVVEAVAFAGRPEIDKVNETLNALLGMLIPEVEEARDARAKRMARRLKKLDRMGTIKVRAMDEGGFRHKRKHQRVEKS